MISRQRRSSTIPLLAILFLLPLGDLSAVELQTGDSAERIKEVLGRPNGIIILKNKQVLFFDRGEVTLIDGKATRLDILSEEESLVELNKQKQKRERAARLVEERIRNRVAQGLAKKEDKLTSPDFLASSAYTRLEFWRDFRRRYPEVDVSDQLAATLKERSKELEQQADEQRVAQLEVRVREAEYRARRAERRSYYRGSNSFYNFSRPNYVYRFPTTGHFGFAGRPAPHHRTRSSATYHRGNRLNDCDNSTQSGSHIVSSGFHHGGQFQRQPVPPPVRFPTFFAPDLQR